MAFMAIQPIVLYGFLSFLLGFKETSWVFQFLYLAVTSYFAASLERRCCWGWTELLLWYLLHSKLRLQLPQIHLRSIFLPSPLLLQRRLMVGAAGTGRIRASSASPWARTYVEWWRPQILIICPNPGVNCWPIAVTAGARKLLISSLQSSGSFPHSPSIIYPRASDCRLRITALLSSRLLVQAWCHCCQPPCSLQGHNPHNNSIFSLAKREGQWEGTSSLHLWAQHIYSWG